MSKYVAYYFFLGAILVFTRILFMSDEKAKSLNDAVDKHVKESIIQGLNPKVVIGLSSFGSVLFLVCVWPFMLVRPLFRKKNE